MRFTRTMRGERPPPSQRRIAAAARSIAKDKAEVPLFPELVKHTSPEQRIADKDADWTAHWQKMRDHHARTWRRSRVILRTHPQAKEILAKWNSGFCPASPEYLADLIHCWGNPIFTTTTPNNHQTTP